MHSPSKQKKNIKKYTSSSKLFAGDNPQDLEPFPSPLNPPLDMPPWLSIEIPDMQFRSLTFGCQKTQASWWFPGFSRNIGFYWFFWFFLWFLLIFNDFHNFLMIFFFFKDFLWFLMIFQYFGQFTNLLYQFQLEIDISQYFGSPLGLEFGSPLGLEFPLMEDPAQLK